MSGSFESSGSLAEDLFKEEGISFRIVGDISALKDAHNKLVEGYKQKNPDMESLRDRVRQIAKKVLDCSDFPDKLKKSVEFYYGSVLLSNDMVEVKKLGDILDKILDSEMRLDVADPTSTTNICTSTDGGKVLTDATNNSTTNVSTSCSNRSSSSTTSIVKKKTTRWGKASHTEPLVTLMRKGLIDPDLATKCGSKTTGKPNEKLRKALVEIFNGDVLANSGFELSVSEKSFINGYMRESAKFRLGEFDNLEIVENETKIGRSTRFHKTKRDNKKTAGNMSSNDAPTKDTTSTNAESGTNENNDPTSVSVVSPEGQVQTKSGDTAKKPSAKDVDPMVTPSPEVQTKSDDTAKKPSAKDADPMVTPSPELQTKSDDTAKKPSAEDADQMVTPSPEVQTKRMVSFNKSVKTTYLEPIPDEEGDDDDYDSFDLEAEMLELDNEVLETKATKNLENQEAFQNLAKAYQDSANEGKEFNSHLEGMRSNTKMLGQLAAKSPAPKKKEFVNKFRRSAKKVKGVVAVAEARSEARSKAVDVSQSDAASNNYETPTSNVYETPLQKKKLFGGEQD